MPGITPVLVATGIFEPFNVKQDQENWEAKLKVNGILTNITYQSSVAVPGATTGWRSSPGPAVHHCDGRRGHQCRTRRIPRARRGSSPPDKASSSRRPSTFSATRERSRLDGRQPTFGRSTSPRGSMLLPRGPVRSNSLPERAVPEHDRAVAFRLFPRGDCALLPVMQQCIRR